MLPDSGEDVAQLRVAQSKRKAHTTSKAAKLWTTGPSPPHLKNRKGKGERKESKSLHTETESLHLLAQWAVTGFESALHLHTAPLQAQGSAPWALTADKKVLMQLTLISSAALTLGEFRILVVASAQEQCLGKSKGTLNVFIERFH